MSLSEYTRLTMDALRCTWNATDSAAVIGYGVRKCRGHWHVTQAGEDLIVPGDPFATINEAIDAANRLEAESVETLEPDYPEDEGISNEEAARIAEAPLRLAELESRVRAQGELIAELELDKKRLDVLEEMREADNIWLWNGSVTAIESLDPPPGHFGPMFATLREFADAVSEATEHEESEK
jgi:hypothetical protein